MEPQPHKPAPGEIADEVARIIFGDDNLTDMNVRLTRIALERYDISEGQTFESLVQGVTRIIFGDENVSDMNVRLTRLALERYHVREKLNQPAATGSNHPAETNGAPSRAPRLAVAPM